MTPQERQLFLEIVNIMMELIEHHTKTSPVGGLPSGELYTKLMGKMSIENYQAIIDALVRTGKITNKNHLLKAVTK
jgi:hypothetical protein